MFLTMNSRLAACVFMLMICATAVIAQASSQYQVKVIADGRTVVVTTAQTDAESIVAQADVTLNASDKIDASSFEAGSRSDSNNIRVYRGVNVTITDNGVKGKSFVCAGTVKDALEKAGITVRSVDKINYSNKTELKNNMNIVIKRAYVVNVTADGKTESVEFIEGTVADVLSQCGVTLDEDDETNIPLTDTVKLGDSIIVYRVSYSDRTVNETIPYTTVTQKSSEVYTGQTVVSQSGSNGSQTVVYRDKTVDGKVSSTSVVSKTVTKAAVNCIKLVGTKVKLLSTASAISTKVLPSKYSLADGIPTSNVGVITGRSTAYYGGGGTASGAKAQSGYVAVNPNQIPYGSELYIVSSDGKYIYGYCIAADTGGFAYNGSGTVVDVYMDTYSECCQWGSRQVTIYVLSWGSGRV